MLLAQILRHQYFHRLAHEVLRGVPEQHLGAAVDEHDPAVTVGDDRGVCSCMQQFVDNLGGQPAGGHRGTHGNG